MLASTSQTSSESSKVSPRVLALLALIIAIAGVMRFTRLGYAPAGGHGDVAWIGLDALDWLDSGRWHYYVKVLSAPEPVIVYLTGLVIPFAGVSYLAPRIVTAVFGLLFVAALFPATWWLLEGKSRRFRERAGLLASLAAATSLHAMFLSRLGMRSPLFPAAVTLFVWLTAWAWHRGGWQRWALAGVVLAFTQYIFIPARLLPVVVGLWLAHAWWSDREKLRSHWRGILLMAAIAFVLTLPNIITFILTPEAFTARADNGTAATGGWIWLYTSPQQGGLLSILVRKMGVILAAIGVYWNGPYTINNRPMLAPLFFVGFLLALVMLVRRPRHIAYAWPVLAIPIMLITDLISGAAIEAHALHQIGVLPFAYILAGLGLAHLWEWSSTRPSSKNLRYSLAAGALAATIGSALWGTYRYLTDTTPAVYANPASGTFIEQTDVDIARRIIAQPDTAYLLPYEEYTRSNVAWITSEVFRERHSAINAQGMLDVPQLPADLTVVMPSNPFRLRHDGAPAQLDTRLWVLLVDGQALLLPPLTLEQEQTTLDFIDNAQVETLLDGSDTPIATFHSGNTPTDLFAPRPVIDHPLDATFNDRVRLLGYSMRDTDLTPGEIAFITLYWQPIDERPSRDYEVFVQIWDDERNSLALAHGLPYDGMYHTRLWQPDEVTATHQWVTIPEDLPQGRYSLVAGLFRILQNTRLAASGSSVDSSGDVIRVADLRFPIEQPRDSGTPLAQSLVFGDVLDVAGMDIALDGTTQSFGQDWAASPGQTLTIDVTWQVLARPAVDYSGFLHLSQSDDQPLQAQSDALLGGSYPSGAWRAGELQADSLTLQLPPDLPSGEYTLWSGIYYFQTGERLTPLLDGESLANDRVKLGTIIIQ